MGYPLRQRLNANHLAGNIAIAAIFGALTGSFAVFMLVAGVLVARSIVNGDIRPPRILKR